VSIRIFLLYTGYCNVSISWYSIVRGVQTIVFLTEYENTGTVP
jgi:hypothetical protein